MLTKETRLTRKCDFRGSELFDPLMTVGCDRTAEEFLSVKNARTRATGGRRLMSNDFSAGTKS